MEIDYYMDVWTDITGMPTHCDEQLFRVSDFHDPADIDEALVMGFRVKKNHQPIISIRVKKGSRAQCYAHWFIGKLKDTLNNELEETDANTKKDGVPAKI